MEIGEGNVRMGNVIACQVGEMARLGRLLLQWLHRVAIVMQTLLRLVFSC